MRLFIGRACLLAATLLVAWAGVISVGAGTEFSLAGLTITSNDPWRPFVAGLVLTGLAVATQGWGATRALGLSVRGWLTARSAVIAMALMTTGLSFSKSSWTASGPDSSAYLSQAEMFGEGGLFVPVPLATEAPWPNAVTTFAPFGYRAAADGRAAMVPVTAPGLPIVMAAFQRMAGTCAAFAVTPLAAGLLILLTFGIGCRIATPAVGAWAAWLVATSPAWLFMLMWPMSDVPAAAAVALMVWLALRPSRVSTFAAGVSGATALLIRSNLLIAVAGVGVWMFVRWFGGRDAERRGWLTPALFALGTAPGLIVMAWLNTQWYGSPLASGYGNTGEILSIERLGTNAWRYLTWLTESSPVAWLGLVALVVPGARRWWSPPRATHVGWLFTTILAAVASIYLVYQSFTDWWYLRFFLPAWPMLFIATALWWIAFPGKSVFVRAVLAVVFAASGVAGVVLAGERGAFGTGRAEWRYASVARLVDRVVPPEAVIVTAQHAGSVRYYAGREILRWDELDPTALDGVIDWLAARNRRPIVLVEDWERPLFEGRFAASNRHGTLAYPPVAAWQSADVSGWVWIYDPQQPAAATYRPPPDFELTQPWCASPASAKGQAHDQALHER